MDTTVTGIFPNRHLAARATAALVAVDFRPDQISVVDANTPDRHDFIHKKSSDTTRGVVLGVVFGAIGGSLTGVALARVFGLVPAAVIGGLVAAVGGGFLGLVIGRATTSQVEDELEHQLDTGTVLVSVTTDDEQKAVVLQVLAQEGGTSVVSTAVSFTAGVLPSASQQSAASEARLAAAGSPSQPAAASKR